MSRNARTSAPPFLRKEGLKKFLEAKNIHVVIVLERAVDNPAQLFLIQLQLLSDGVLHRQVTGALGSFRSGDDPAVVFKPRKEIFPVAHAELQFRYDPVEFPRLNGWLSPGRFLQPFGAGPTRDPADRGRGAPAPAQE